MSIPPYPAYKPTGIGWLPEVPAHWQLSPAKRFMEATGSGTLIKGECAQEPTEGLFPAFSASGQDVWVEEFQHQRPGIVLSAVGARCGKTFKADGRWGVVANTNCLFPVGGADRDFLWYVTNDERWWEIGGTAQPFVRVSDTLARIWVLPPPAEQSAIATFLDRETGKIDALVAEQERLIALLKEKRQAVISQAVTKGLDPNARMKDSGVEWLGEVPAHWEVRKLLTGLRESPCYGVLVPDFDESGVPMLRINDIENGVADRGTLTTITPTLSAQYARTIVQSGDIALSVVGTIGEAIQIDATLAGVNLSRALARLQLNGSLLADFLCSVFQSRAFERFVDLTCVGTAQRVLNMSALSAFRIAFPPPAEQAAISAYLEDQTRRLSSLIAEAERAIALLKERRAALISAAVTGKIDVRGLVALEEAEAA